MVLAVADRNGEVLGLFRMPDATIFSIDVSVAKARNTAYYADAADSAVRRSHRFQRRRNPRRCLRSSGCLWRYGAGRYRADAVARFDFWSEPRYPTGSELSPSDDDGLVNDPLLDLCDQRPDVCQKIGPQSMLRRPGVNPLTAENLVNLEPLAASVYADPTSPSVLAFDAFNVSRNFRDPGDASVVIAGTGIAAAAGKPERGRLLSRKCVDLYEEILVGGFGVSGDGVDQDDVVTSAGLVGFDAPTGLRVDQFPVGFVRLPYLKFNRNPRGA